MTRVVLSVAGVILAIWLVFTVLGAIVSTLKTLLLVGVLAFGAFFAVKLLLKLTRA